MGWVAALALGALLLAPPGLAQTASPLAQDEGAPPMRPTPDLLVVVLCRPDGSDHVGVTYAGQIDHQQLRAALEQLAREVNGEPQGLSITDDPVARGAQALATSAEFTLHGLVPRNGEPLPVLLIARTLPRWRMMRIAFVPGGEFRFSGPRSYQGPHFRFHLVSDTDSYLYNVVRLYAGASESPPTAEPSEQPPPQPPVSGPPAWLRPAALALAGVIVSAFAWLAISRARRRTGRLAAGAEPENDDNTNTVSAKENDEDGT